MSQQQYTYEQLPQLEFDKKRFRVKYCPCGKTNYDGKFIPYVGYENNGYCHSCGKTFLPKLPNNKLVKIPNLKSSIIKNMQPEIAAKSKYSTIPINIFKTSLNDYGKNNFVQFLITLFGEDVTKQLISRYFIGTSNRWSNATIFWQIDTTGNIRTGKIMLYNPHTCKRVKEPNSYIAWVHTNLKQPEFSLKQCLFGEHLLADKIKPIAIVESEKTAIIASVYLPQFIWLAIGSLSSLNFEKSKILQGRNVTLYPDINGFKLWSSKAKELSHITNFNVSNLLEQKATEDDRKQGLDLADFLLKFNYESFHLPVIPSQLDVINIRTINSLTDDTLPNTTINWDKQIADLEVYFKSITLPNQSLKLNRYSTITNLARFVESHLATVKTYNGNQNYLPYLDRLQKIKEILIQEA